MRSLISSLQRLTSRWLEAFNHSYTHPRQRKPLVAGLLLLPIIAMFAGLVVWTEGPGGAEGTSVSQSVERSAVSSEIRGVWITNVASSVLYSPWGIANAVHQLADLHFNTVYPVVWNRGKTFYHSQVLKQTTGYAIAPLMALAHPTEDPLAEMVRLGHKNNLRIIPWFEYGFMVPLHSKLARQHPEWLTQRANGSYKLHEATLTGNASGKSSLLGKLLSSGAPRTLGWLNPLHPDVQILVLDMVGEVASQYDVEGIQFDDHFSLPVDFGYDAYTVSLYQTEHDGQQPPADAADADWIRWRADKFSEFVGRLHARIQETCSTCLFSLSPNPAKFAYRFHLQDWLKWVDNGWIDEVVVQVYRDDMDKFEGELAKETLHSTMDRLPVSIGILTGTWRRPIPFEQIKEQVISSRDHHFSGVTFFYWDTLWSYFTPESPQQRRQNFRELLAQENV
ncbi:MAG: family 10 glycosylhydrolase [Cyanobacteria bacterium J06598_1]